MSYPYLYMDDIISTPMDDEGNYLYQTFQCIGTKVMQLNEYTDLDEAKAEILNEPHFLGGEMFVREIDLDSGKEECVFCAYYDEDLQRYLED